MISSNLVRIRSPGRRSILEVLLAFLLSDPGQEQFRRRAVGATATRALTVDALASLDVPVPDQRTQKQITELWRATQRSSAEAHAAADERRAFGVALVERLLIGAPLPPFTLGARE